MLQVKQIVNEIFTSNTYILFDDEYDYCWLVDIGEYKKVADALPPKMEIRGVLLTHTHFDHIYGINELYQAWPNINVYTSEFGSEALYDARINLSRYHLVPIEYKGKNICILKDQEAIEIFPRTILVTYETPGHSPCCLTFNVEDKWFTGDAYIPGVKIVTKLPRGDRKTALLSKERITTLANGQFVCPGHGECIIFVTENQ